MACPWFSNGSFSALFVDKSCNQEIWKCPALQSQVQALSEVQGNPMALHFPLSRPGTMCRKPLVHKSDSFLGQTEKNPSVNRQHQQNTGLMDPMLTNEVIRS